MPMRAMPGLSMLACGGSESVWWCEEKNENRERKNPQNGKEKITLSFNGAPLGGEREEKKEKKTRGGGECGKISPHKQKKRI